MERIKGHKELLHNISVAQNLRFYQTIIFLLTQLVAAFPSLGKTFNPLVATLNEALKIYKKPRFSTLTPELKSLDTLRDALTKAINAIADAKKVNPLAAAALKVILPLLTNYAKLESVEYEQETEMIDNLLAELLKAANAAHLLKLGINEEVQQLKAANEQFQALYIQRSDETYVKKVEGTSTEYRQKLNDAFVLFCKAIEGLLLTIDDPAQLEQLTQMVDHINATIEQFAKIYNRHKANLGNKHSGTQTPDITLPTPPDLIIVDPEEPLDPDPEEPEEPEEPDVELPDPPHPSFE